METLATAIRYSHVVFGFAGLAAFWIPVFSKKGGPRHVLFGKIFYWCAYIVLASAGVSVLYRLNQLIESGRPAGDATFAFVVFLGYLAFVTFVILRHGLGVLRSKKDPIQLATPFNKTLAVASIVASVGLIGYAVYFAPPNRILLFALSPIGLGVGYGNLRYMLGKLTSPRQWLYEHLGSMLGAGIAFHTAFAVFGSTQIFDLQLSGVVQVIPWILPAVVGIPASILWTRYYQRKFGERPAH